MEVAELALVFSGIALIVAMISLYANSLASFSLRVAHDAPTLALYKIDPSISGSEDGKTWWVPSFDIGFSFLNAGRRPGEVLDVRIVAEFEGHRSKKRYAFYPNWVVDYSSFQRSHTDRFQWIHEAVLRDWYPLSLSGQKDTHVHLILEGERWDEKLQGVMKCNLQIISSGRKQWIDLGQYEWLITDDMFEEKSTHTALDKRIDRVKGVRLTYCLLPIRSLATRGLADSSSSAGRQEVSLPPYSRQLAALANAINPLPRFGIRFGIPSPFGMQRAKEHVPCSLRGSTPKCESRAPTKWRKTRATGSKTKNYQTKPF